MVKLTREKQDGGAWETVVESAGGGSQPVGAVILDPDADERNVISPALDVKALTVQNAEAGFGSTILSLIQNDGSPYLIEMFNLAYNDTPAAQIYINDSGEINFSSDQDIIMTHGLQIAGGGGSADGWVSVHGASSPFQCAQLGQLSSYATIESGALPDTGAWVSGTAKANPSGVGVDTPSRQVTVMLEIVTDGTNNAATCAVAISPNDDVYTTIATPGVAAAVNNVGAHTLAVPVVLPQNWYIKITLSHCSVAASKWY